MAPRGNEGRMKEQELIYDWNVQGTPFDYSKLEVELDDETLRDGLQNPSVTDPPIEKKIELLHLMDELGIHTADIGLPGAGPRAKADTLALAKEIRDAKLSIAANCAARTVEADILAVVDISQAVGIPIEVCTFIGSSPIRRYAEGWTVDFIRETTEKAIKLVVDAGLPSMYVTEDTTRSDPQTLETLFTTAIAAGTDRLCLADTVGHATPNGTRTLVKFAREVVARSGVDVKIDWHGHRDRGFGLANCLAAIEEGVHRVHGTALGIGERVGNAEMDLLLLNLKLLGAHHRDLSRLPEYVRVAADACGLEIAHNYPAMGADAFRTGTGVHAAAIIKAKQKGHDWLADRIYSGVPAGEFGLRQVIEISHVSGLSNVKFWLLEHGYDADDDEICKAIFERAKAGNRVLSEDEIKAIIETCMARR